MPDRREIGIVFLIQEHCERIIAKTNNINKADFIVNTDLIEICCFNLLQIGELVTKLPISFIENEHIELSKIKGMRNRIVHGYGDIDFEIVFETSKKDIPILNEVCQKITKDIIY